MTSLLIATVAVCAVLSWRRECQNVPEPAEEVERLRPEIARLRVNDILRSEIPDEGKAIEIAAFVKPGNTWSEVRERLGAQCGVGTYGPGFSDHEYEMGLVVSAYPDGEVFGVGYYAYVNDKTQVLKCLIADDPITWPKTARTPRRIKGSGVFALDRTGGKR
jgi:hypothetical protein